MIKVEVLGFSGGGEKNKGLTSFLVNDRILIDAGNVVAKLSAEEQSKITDILVSHSHLDHIKDIPLLCDNFVDIPHKKVNVYALKETIDALKNNLFNNIIFPDFAVIPLKDPVVVYHEVEPNKEFYLDHIKFTAIKVNHTVPNVAYILENQGRCFVFISDTYATSEIYQIINELPKVDFVIIETSFPNNLQELAKVSKHLTPKLMAREIAKIKDNNIKIYIYHLKPKFAEEITEEINSLQTDKQIEILREGMVIEI
jgi:ribonuclease BN (tRNA processing enzyme)